MGSSTGYKEFVGASDAKIVGGKFVDETTGTAITGKKYLPLNDFGAGDIPMCVLIAC